MSTQVKIWIALTVTVVMVLAALWQFANMRGARNRGRRRTTAADRAAAQRRGDSRVLTGPERRLLGQAKELAMQGKSLAASRIYEQLAMPREAIQTLEDAGMIHEAASILIRMQRHNRAGVIYARHAMWAQAAQSFKLANMPLEVAKCAREAGNFELAGEYFQKAGRIEDAANCYEAAGHLQTAARLYAQAGDRNKAMSLYDRMASGTDNISALEFHEEEFQQIVDYLGEGNATAGLADLVVNRNRLADVVLNLVAKGMVRQASEIYLRATSDIGPVLMAEVSYGDKSAKCLAELFMQTSAFHYAGMVYERMGSFDLAGQAFEKAEDFDRAAHCFERAGVDAKVQVLKEKARTTPYKGRPGSPNFALANVATPAAASFDAGNDESTQMLDVRKTPATPPEPARRAAPPTTPPPARQVRHDEPPAPPSPPPKRGMFSLQADVDDDVEENAKAKPAAAAAAPPVPRFSQTDTEDRAEPDGEQESPVPPPPAFRSSHQARGPADPSGTPEDAGRLPDPSLKVVNTPVGLDEGKAVFHKAKFFADLDYDQKNKIWNIGRTLEFSEEESVLDYNGEPEGIYVIIAGSVSCYKQTHGKEIYVDQMGESDSFGELWLLADQPTTVKFTASKETRIRVIGRDAFNDLLDKDGTIARKLYKRFTMRLLKRLLKPQNNSKNQQAS